MIVAELLIWEPKLSTIDETSFNYKIAFMMAYAALAELANTPLIYS